MELCILYALVLFGLIIKCIHAFIHCRMDLHLQEVWVSLTCLLWKVKLFFIFLLLVYSVTEVVLLDVISDGSNIKGTNVSSQKPSFSLCAIYMYKQ